MAGLKVMEKKPAHLDFIVNELLKPDVRNLMFDDMFGMAEISMALYSPLTVVYGIFEKGHPVPIGVVILDGVKPFRGCAIHAAIFKPENRNSKKLQGVIEGLRQDLIVRHHLHYAEARIVSSNLAAKHLAEKMGMKKVGTKAGNVFCNGKYEDVDEYYIVLDGDKLFDV